jgi:hypothetical protein
MRRDSTRHTVEELRNGNVPWNTKKRKTNTRREKNRWAITFSLYISFSHSQAHTHTLSIYLPFPS